LKAFFIRILSAFFERMTSSRKLMVISGLMLLLVWLLIRHFISQEIFKDVLIATLPIYLGSQSVIDAVEKYNASPVNPPTSGVGPQ
jgi:hypothetical protein